jgi:REP element-mobilizing transposase RayT
MSSFIRVVLHTTFSTKFRRKLIRPDVEPNLYYFIRSRLTHLNCWTYEIGGVLDHVHILHSLPRTTTIANAMNDVKSLSSRWMKKQGIPNFQWQHGYACHSVDYRRMEGIRRYIRNQKAHHYGSAEHYLQTAERTFEQEFLQLLHAFEMDYDDRYLFPVDPKVGQ